MATQIVGASPRSDPPVLIVYVIWIRHQVRLREKGGKPHAMPCHHRLEEYLHAYLVVTGIDSDPKGPLFRTIGRGTDQLSSTAIPQANAHAMVRRRALAAGIQTLVGNHFGRPGSPPT